MLTLILALALLAAPDGGTPAPLKKPRTPILTSPKVECQKRCVGTHNRVGKDYKPEHKAARDACLAECESPAKKK